MSPTNLNRGSANRRHFIKASTLVGAAALGPVHLLAAKPDLTKDKLNIAVVGAGGRGGANLNGCSGENIYAICDINK
ncbi:MAG: twin-arginine translocation signal domain-containing protein, partial [Planctomycetaceae bacterium]|nr:twin-arginine translocation signal domain-containing protein [Planctomycetaceae bacterium]